MSTESEIGARLSTGRRLAMIWAVASRRRNGRGLPPRAVRLALPVVGPRGALAHRRRDLLQWQPARERDQDAGGEDDAEKYHGDRQRPARNIAERPVERLLRLLFTLAHLDRQ